MKFRRRADFALLETICVGITAIVLAVILVPPFIESRTDPDRMSAMADVQKIAAALLNYSKDTGLHPISRENGDEFEYLKGPGKDPAGADWTQENVEVWTSYLPQKPTWVTKWNGPYLRGVNADPWGSAYVIHVKGYKEIDRERVWVLSAGPNGRIETPRDSETLLGDDVGIQAF